MLIWKTEYVLRIKFELDLQPQLDAIEQMEELPEEACKEEPMDETSATPAPIEPPQIVIEASQKAEDGINAVEEKPPVLTEQSQSTNRGKNGI